MCVPLRDQSGKVRYYLGAQLDITGLVNDCTGLATLKNIVERNNEHRSHVTNRDVPKETIEKDEFEQLSEAFNPQELEKLIMLRRRQQLQSEEVIIYADSEKKQRGDDSTFRSPLTELENSFQLNGQGSAPPLGYYKTVSTSYEKPILANLANYLSIFWFDLIHLSAFCLPRPICGYLESSSRLYLVESEAVLGSAGTLLMLLKLAGKLPPRYSGYLRPLQNLELDGFTVPRY